MGWDVICVIRRRPSRIRFHISRFQIYFVLCFCSLLLKCTLSLSHIKWEKNRKYASCLYISKLRESYSIQNSLKLKKKPLEFSIDIFREGGDRTELENIRRDSRERARKKEWVSYISVWGNKIDDETDGNDKEISSSPHT